MSKDCMDISKDAAIDAYIAKTDAQHRAIEAQRDACFFAQRNEWQNRRDLVTVQGLTNLFATANRCERLEKELRDERALNYVAKLKIEELEKAKSE